MKRIYLLSLLACSTLSSTAHASGYLVARYGGDHGTPAMANTFAVFFNPAAIAGTEGTNISLDAAPVLRLAAYERGNDALSNPTLADLNNNSADATRYRAANTGKATLTNILALGFFGLTTDLGLKNSPIRLGYATSIPFGGLASWDKRSDAITQDPEAPGAVDGVQRWANISGKIFSIFNTLAISAMIVDKPNARFSIGASFSGVFNIVDTSRARTIGSNDDSLQVGNTLAEGRALVQAHGLNFAAGAGLYFEIPKKLSLGLSYMSQPGFGTMRLSGELTADNAGPAKGAAVPIEFLQAFPDVIRLGAEVHVSEKITLRSDLEFARWSVFDKQCVVNPGSACDIQADGNAAAGSNIQVNIPRNWKDALGARLGMGYHLTEDTEIFGSAAFATKAAPNSTMDASTIDAFRIYATAGVHHRFSNHFQLGSSLNGIFFMPNDTGGANNLDKLQGVSKSPSGDGKYTSIIAFLNVNGTYRF